jgi:hypothetical protein
MTVREGVCGHDRLDTVLMAAATHDHPAAQGGAKEPYINPLLEVASLVAARPTNHRTITSGVTPWSEGRGWAWSPHLDRAAQLRSAHRLRL